jgi:hypothetical protein
MTSPRSSHILSSVVVVIFAALSLLRYHFGAGETWPSSLSLDPQIAPDPFGFIPPSASALPNVLDPTYSTVSPSSTCISSFLSSASPTITRSQARTRSRTRTPSRTQARTRSQTPSQAATPTQLISVGASQSFTPSQTASTPPRTCNVLEYGAVGDGSTDDTDAIQDAINACAVVPLATAWLPPGYL